MGPYRTNAAPLRARRQELRLELDDVEAKMIELSLARDVVERAIEDWRSLRTEEGASFDREEWVNLDHLNVRGAEKFSARLAEALPR